MELVLKHDLILCVGCDASCPLDEFIELTKAAIPTDLLAECSILSVTNS